MGLGKDFNDMLERDSQSIFRFEPFEFGEETGGVTGALLEILKGGRFVGIEEMLRRNGIRYADWFASKRDGLGKEDDVGLAW